MKLLQTKTLGAAEETHIRFLNPSLSHRGSSKKKKKSWWVESENRRGFARKKGSVGASCLGEIMTKNPPFRGHICSSGSPESH